MAAPQRVIHLMHNSEQPASCFAVLDTGTCLVADSLLDLIIVKLKEFYTSRKNVRVEAKGQRYELADFIIKIGSVVVGQNTSFKGILVEVCEHFLQIQMTLNIYNKWQSTLLIFCRISAIQNIKSKDIFIMAQNIQWKYDVEYELHLNIWLTLNAYFILFR